LDDEAAIPQAERIKQEVSVLKATPDIIDVRPVPEEETTKLLEPWISEPDLLKKLPLPALIDIERRDGSNVTASELEDRLRATINDARVDDHAAWLADIAHLVGSLSVMAIFMIVLTGGALMISIALICRAVMATERDTVELLHIMGAPDRNIASHFQNHAWRLAWPAALAGFGLAVFSLALLLFFIRHVADLSGMQFARWLELALLVIAVPMAAVLAASFSAKISVVRLLRSLP
jgi:cell division transport system permease protein